MPQPDPPDRPPLNQTRVSPPRAEPPRIPGLEPVEDTSGHQAPDATVKSGRGRPGAPAGMPATIGRFEIRAVLGEGAFGRVYRGYDAQLERDVAIKVPHGSAMTEGFRDRFLREARAAATIHHPNVCPIYEAGTDGELPYLVIHFVAGPTLSSLVEKRAGPFPVKQAVVVVRKLALGVAAAHERGVVHRDLKPANVLVDEVRREVLITDFGVARVGDSGQTVDGDVIGTPAYMSPEQAMGKKGGVGPLADVYSLGVILYRLLAGRVPYQGSVFEVLAQVWEGKPVPPRQLRPELDPRLNDLCLKAMAKDPQDRFPSAAALASALEGYLKARPTEESREQLSLVGPTARPVAAADASDAVEAELAFDLPATARPMLTLMQAVAAAVVAEGLSGLGRRVADPKFPPRLAAEVIRRCRVTSPGGLPHLLGVTAGANIADAQVAAAQAAWETAAQAAEDDRLALELYLGQLPDAIRKAFKRADDPTGATVPRDFRAESTSALADLLPRRVPRLRGGQALPGRPEWTLVRWLGGGGFGEVWLARHRRVDNLFGAVKFGLDLTPAQRKQLARDAAQADRALNEHPNPGLVPLLDTHLDGDTPWLMYEYVGGGDLADLVLAWELLPPGGRARAAVERLREVVEAVAVMHRARPAVVHRDLKPANVLRDASTFRLRVTDFGAGGTAVAGQLARRREASAPEPRGAHSLLYASPQHLRGDPPDPRDDVYALGVLAFQMLTGRLTGGVPADYDRALRAAGVPPALVKLVGDCTASDPNARPKDAQAVLALLSTADQAPAAPGGAARKVVGSEFVLEVTGRSAEKETLTCPVCKARLQVEAGRAEPVPCPRCSTKFAPAAGRVALKVRPLAAPPRPEVLELDDPEEDLPPEPAPRPKRRPPERRDDRRRAAPPPRRRGSVRRRVKWAAALLLLGAGAVAGLIYQEELTTWAEGRRAKPVEFVSLREFEPGSDTARVYGFLPGEPNLLLTNADRKDVLAAVWNLQTGRRECVLKGGPAQANAAVDPAVTQFRYDPEARRVAVFNRDPQALDRGGVWVYDLPPAADDPKADDPQAKGGKAAKDDPADREVTPAELGPRRRAWDVSRDLSRAVGEPKGGKVALWSLATGAPVKELAVDGTTFRGVAFSPDGKYVVGLCDESRVRVWDADTGDLDRDRSTRLGTRPAWDAAEIGILSFDPAFTRIAVTTDAKTGSWDLKTGAALDPMKKLSDGTLLQQHYRLRPESGGRGTFSVFNDEFTLRACKLSLGGDGAVTTWCLSADRGVLAASSDRKVQVWRLKYPAAAPAPAAPKKDDPKADDVKKGDPPK